MSRAQLELHDDDDNRAHNITLCELGKAHAREWLKSPHSKPLALLRLEFQDSITDSIQWGIETNQEGLITAVSILDMLAMYNAGIDDVLNEFIRLAMTGPAEVYQ